MAVEQHHYDITLEAARDLTDNQYHVMAGSGARGCDLAGAADEDSLGIVQNKPEGSGHAANVRRGGISKAVCGGTIPVWSKVTSDANSHMGVAAEGERYIGLAEEVGATGRIISIVMEFGYVPASS